LRHIKDKRDEGTISVFDLLKLSFPVLTLKIESDQDRSLETLISYANAFFFQISYNLDVAYVPRRYLEEIVRTTRIRRVRRSRPDELEAPKRSYIPDIVYHYQMAVAADSPALEFISYYHVLEHFFEAVFTDDLIRKVRNKVTLPGFSYKRKKDVKDLIDDIVHSFKFQRDNVSIDERKALELTLGKYVDVTQLATEIKQYDKSLIEYYRTKSVTFSVGDTVNLELPNSEQVLPHLASCIYKTRNAIVHSKDTEKARYKPFEHDNLLVKEIPLIRFIAELTIITTSDIL